MPSESILARRDSDSDDDDGPKSGRRNGRMQELLANYYGMQRGTDRSSDIESTAFDSKGYVRGLLRTEKMETLLQKDDEMVREVKKLDSDMQMLVYENYNKFISATDTIRKMAQNVEGMETEMADLGSSVDRISESSAKVNAALEDNRSKMDKLVRVRRLLRRLDFLFQLPQKLDEAVQAGEYAKAIRYFSMTKDILRKHSHVSSFGAIQRDCEDTVRRLQQKLQDEINSPDVNRDTLVFHADLLLKLGVDPAGLKERYLDAHRRQLQAFLSASRGALVEDYSVSLDACLGKLAEGFLPLLLRTVQMYCQLFQRNEPPAPARVEGEESADKSPASAEHAVNGKAEGADPSQGGAEKSARVPEVGVTPEAGTEGGEELVGLVQLAQSSVDGFFELLNAKVAHSLSRDTPSGGASTSSSSGGTPEASERRSEMTGNTGEADELDAVALGGVVAAVQQLVSDMETVDPHVPQVFLAQRAREFAQEFKRSQVRRSFRGLCRTSLAIVNSLVTGIREGTPAEDLLLELPESGGGSGWGGVGAGGPTIVFGRSNSLGAGKRRRLGAGGAGSEVLPYQALVDRAIETFLKGADTIVAASRPLSRMDASPRPLADELRYGLWGVVLWLASSIRILAGVSPDAITETLASAEGREYETRVEEEWGARAVGSLGEPLPYPAVSQTPAAEGEGEGDGSGESKAKVAAGGPGVSQAGEGGREGEVVLLLACLCRGLGTTFVGRVSEILGRRVPPTLDQSVHAPPPNFSSSVHSTRSAGSSTLQSGYTDRSFEGDDDSGITSGGAGGAGGAMERRRQTDGVRNRVSAASLNILDHYAETTGRKMSDVLQGALDAPPGGGGWSLAEEPTAVAESVLDALEIAEDSVKELCAFLGEARTGTVSVSRSGDRDWRRGSNPSLGGKSGKVGGVRRDIDRIFEAGGGLGPRGPLSGGATVSFAADAMLAAVFRVALKAFGERARYLTVPGPGFRQVHLDADFLRQVLPYYVAESQMLSTLDRLLDQAIQSAADRSLEPTPLDSSTAGDIVAQALEGFK